MLQVKGALSLDETDQMKEGYKGKQNVQTSTRSEKKEMPWKTLMT